MAGGKFNKLSGKTRPGTYINFESTRSDILGISERGIVLIPLIGHTYGLEKEFITLTNESPDGEFDKLGYSIYDDNDKMLLIREAFKVASKVIVYIPKVGKKATGSGGGLKATAKYGGSRGNLIRYSVIENPINGFDVNVYFDDVLMNEYESIMSVNELIQKENQFIDFKEDGELSQIAGVTLDGGTDETTTNSDITEFLDKMENIKFNTLAFPVETSALKEACFTKIKYLRENIGKGVKAVMANFDADYEGIINVTNSVVVDGKSLTNEQATAWVAGVDAGASNIMSNTYLTYLGATDIVGTKTHEQAVNAIKNGEFFFSHSEEGKVVVEYDINSLVTYKDKKDKTYSKNRTIRVFDTFAEAVKLNFPPNKYDNSPTGWEIMEGVGKTILKQFFEAGAIKNVDYDADFLVDRQTSTGDQVFFDIGLEPVDSAEKLFFTIKTR